MAAVAAAAIALSACAASSDDDAASDALEAPAALDTEERPTASEESEGGSSQPGQIGTSQIDLGTVGRDVIVEMRVTMTSTDLRATVEGIMRSASGAGGGVASSDVDYGTSDSDEPSVDGHAVLIVKVPPEQVDGVLSALDDIGTVTGIATDAQDVTQQLTDLDVQILNARRSVDRVRELLDQATDLRTVVEIEADLTQRQTRLEQLEATQQALTDRVAYATLTIDVTAVPVADPGAADTGDGGIRDAFADGWNAFLGVLFAIGFVLAVLAPFLGAVALIALVAWLVARQLQRRDQRPAKHALNADEDQRERASPRG
ncbi:MAG TPA: DUF4349 domain-containing protein [Ilumatobacteraceae bacterium]